MKLKNNKGFSLIEMAVSLAVLGALLVVALPTISDHYAGQLAATQKAVIQQSFSEIDNVLLAYSKLNFRLPCPDANDDGLEDCTASNGLLPYRTLGFNAPVTDGYLRKIRYSVYRQPTNDLDLAESTLTDRYVRVLPASAVPKSYLNDLDFCQALRLAQTQAFDATHTHGTHGGVTTHAAYALASGGASDANQNAADGFYDGLNENGGNRFDSTANSINASYDDYVHAMSFAEFAGRLGCGAITTATTAMANHAINAWGQSELADNGLDVSDFDIEVAEFKSTMATVAIVMAGVNVAILISHNLLASAMATAADVSSGITFASIATATAASITEIAATAAAKAQADSYLDYAKDARDGEGGTKPTKDAAVLTEIDLVKKALAADFRGGTTK